MIPVTILTAYPPDLTYPVVDVVDAGYNADVAVTLVQESSFTNRYPMTELVNAGYQIASNSDDYYSHFFCIMFMSLHLLLETTLEPGTHDEDLYSPQVLPRLYILNNYGNIEVKNRVIIKR
jgi:hypothetical protein